MKAQGCTNKQAKAQSHRWCGNHPFMLAWQRSDFSLSPSPWDIIGHAPFSISEPHVRKEWVPALDGNIKQEHGGAPDRPLSGDLNHPSVICCPSLARHTSHTAPFKNNLPMGLICGWLLAMGPFPCECITTLSGITAVQLNINKHFSVTSQSYIVFFSNLVNLDQPTNVSDKGLEATVCLGFVSNKKKEKKKKGSDIYRTRGCQPDSPVLSW